MKHTVAITVVCVGLASYLAPVEASETAISEIEWAGGEGGVWKIRPKAQVEKKTFDHVPYWYYDFALPFERVHMCETCDTLVEVCPVCLEKE